MIDMEKKKYKRGEHPNSHPPQKKEHPWKTNFAIGKEAREKAKKNGFK